MADSLSEGVCRAGLYHLHPHRTQSTTLLDSLWSVNHIIILGSRSFCHQKKKRRPSDVIYSLWKSKSVDPCPVE